MDSFSGKVVVITGSSSGIGRAAAVLFAKHGAHTVICGRNEDGLKKTKEECVQNGAMSENVVHVKADLSKEEGIQSVLDTTISSFRGIDVLVNNAGIQVQGNVEQTKMEDFDALFNINVRAYFRLTQMAIPYLKKSQGSVINVSSVFGARAYPDAVAYSISKAAINMFTDTLALELAPYKVRVNAVCPGYIKTPMAETVGIEGPKLAQLLAEFTKCHPLNRAGDPEEVANLIHFLASDTAGFITGAKIMIDGGLSITAACPGEIKTSIQQAMGIDNLDQFFKYFKDTAKLHPLNQVGEPEDVANLITFLASDAAGFITGAKIPIDRGQSITAAWFGSQI